MIAKLPTAQREADIIPRKVNTPIGYVTYVLMQKLARLRVRSHLLFRIADLCGRMVSAPSSENRL